MIEIRELIIKATVEDSHQNNRGNGTGHRNSAGAERKDCCSDTVELMLQIIKDKKER